MKFSKIGIVGFKGKSPELLRALEKISLFAAKHGEIAFYAVDVLKDIAPRGIRVVGERSLRKCSLLIAIGGDGTFLSSARLALGLRIPILGVNAGRVGFLTETPVESLSEALEAILAGDFTTRDRIMIDARICHGKRVLAMETVLNEVHVRAHAPDRMVNVNVEYNGTGWDIYIRMDSMLSIHPKDFTVKENVASGVLTIGVPAALGSLLMSVSSIVMNSQMAQYGDMALAGVGVAMKVTMMTGMVCIGLGQGVQPLLGYCVGAKTWDRYKGIFRFSMRFALALSVILTVICYLFLSQIVSAFLTDATALEYGVSFSRILLCTSVLPEKPEYQ